MSGVKVEGADEVQQALERAVQVVQPGGEMDKAVTFAVRRAHYYMRSIVHVDTGALKSSLTVQQGQRAAYLYSDPTVTNPRSRQRPAVYGYWEDKRGGSHAFYDRTMAKMPEFAAQAAALIRKALP